ncbi:restriction endonuclease [Halorientalis marina]|uniref:restriction endonuclease n=1 Tax=Halorientalis marina TaxID=2931976 RepID=UPI001FF26630|nr:restriction endonuclease [Halorientalis marina]
MTDDYQTATREMVRTRLQNMDPYEFEHFVADLWTYMDWNTKVVGEPGDKGIDVVATTPENKQLIQAKRYGPNTTVGSPEVQQYASLRLQEENVDQVTIVTTGTFSTQAEALAPDLDVLLIDGSELIGMILELDAVELIAEYFEDVELRSEVESNTTHSEQSGVISRFKSWLE